MQAARRQSFQRKATGFKQFQMSAGLGKKGLASNDSDAKKKLEALHEEEEDENVEDDASEAQVA